MKKRIPSYFLLTYIELAKPVDDTAWVKYEEIPDLKDLIDHNSYNNLHSLYINFNGETLVMINFHEKRIVLNMDTDNEIDITYKSSSVIDTLNIKLPKEIEVYY